MPDTVIKFESVSKSYKIHERGYRSFRGEFTNWMKRIAHGAKSKVYNVSRSAQNTPLSAPNTLQSSQDDDILWALKDVNFEVKKGEALGIIGANGSGKTTILRILSGVTSPTKGTVSVNGKVAPLIQVGAGFHPELTGKENVYLNATIMGLSKDEIDDKYDDIVSFAELKRFMDTPVKRYSSGMYVRLGFAIVANINPDIFLIDEILSVGDMSFQRKCLGTMEKIRKSDKSIIFISHNLSAVNGLCNRIIWLDKGAIQKEGSPDEVINAYTSYMASKSQFVNDISYVGGETRWGTGEAKFTNIEVLDSEGESTDTFVAGDEVTVRLEYEAYKRIDSPVFWVGVFNDDEIRIFGTFYNKERVGKYSIKDKGFLKCTIETLLLGTGVYYIMVGIYDGVGDLAFDRIGRAAFFRIEGKKVERVEKHYGYGAPPGVVNLPHRWE